MVAVWGKMGGGAGDGRRERIEQQEEREKSGKLRKYGQYFVIEKKDKGKERQEKGERDPPYCNVWEEEVHDPPPPPPAPPPSPIKKKMSLAL